jgi:hypothetical protein
MASSKGTDNVLVDGGRVFVLHLLMPFERGWLWPVLGQREDLEGAAIKGDEVLSNEPVPGQDELIDRDSQKGAHLVIGVKRQAVSVGHEHQEQVEQKFTVGEGEEEALFEEAMLDKSEGASDLTDPVGTKDDFFHHGLRPPLSRTLKRKKTASPSSPFLQELGKCAESESIEEISGPSLQDRLWQESGGNTLVLRDKEGLTRPSLQDIDDFGAFGLEAFAGADYALRTEGSSPGISDSSRGFAPSSTGDFLADSCGSPPRSSSSSSASAVSATAGTPSCRNSGGSLRGDREQRAFGSWDWRTGSFESWFLPPRKNHDLIPSVNPGEE